MQEALQIIRDNWQLILEYVLMFIMYFLVFLYNTKIRNTRTTLTSLFKEKVPRAEKALEEAKASYEKAVAERDAMQKELNKYKKAFEIFLDAEEVKDDGLESEG